MISLDRVMSRKERDREKVPFFSCTTPPSVRKHFWKAPKWSSLPLSLARIGQKPIPWPITGKGEEDSEQLWLIPGAGEILSASALSPTLFSFLCVGLILSYWKWIFSFQQYARQKESWEGGMATDSSCTTKGSMTSYSSRLTISRKKSFFL